MSVSSLDSNSWEKINLGLKVLLNKRLQISPKMNLLADAAAASQQTNVFTFITRTSGSGEPDFSFMSG